MNQVFLERQNQAYVENTAFRSDKTNIFQLFYHPANNLLENN